MNDIAEVFKNMNEVYATAAAEGARSVATALQHVVKENAEIRELIIEGLFDDCREDWAGKPTLDLVKDLLRRHNWAVDHSSSAMKWQRDELRAVLEGLVRMQDRHEWYTNGVRSPYHADSDLIAWDAARAALTSVATD